MKKTIAAITIGITLLLTANKGMAGTTTLYDGNSGVTPNNYTSSPWLTFTSANLVSPYTPGTQNVIGSNKYTTLDSSSANSIYAGYSNHNLSSNLVNSSFPTLDRNAGYQLTFTVKINSQTNDGTNGDTRAGFSVIALGSDKQGIEIGFRDSGIFSQASSSFNSIGEQVTSSTVSNIATLLGSLTTYDLNISGSTYTLSSGATTLLNGALRDYTGATGLGSAVYNTANLIFLGDDTTSARANIDLANVSLTTPVPFETSETVSIAVLGAFGGLNYWLRKQKSKQLKN